MKIYNHTKIPLAVLRPVLLAAARTQKLDHQNLHVMVKRNKRGANSGTAYSYVTANADWMMGRRRPHRVRGVYVQRGPVELRIGRLERKPGSSRARVCVRSNDHIHVAWKRIGIATAAFILARGAYLTAVHEFRHVADHRRGSNHYEHNKRWRQRKLEVRAIDAADDAQDALRKRPSHKRAIIELGKWLAEEARG